MVYTLWKCENCHIFSVADASQISVGFENRFY